MSPARASLARCCELTSAAPYASPRTPAAKAANTSGVLIPSRALINSTPGAGSLHGASDVTRSPRPSISTGPPGRKSGTSEPMRVATCISRSSANSTPHSSSAPRSTAAASLDPPPSPAATGSRFSSTMSSGGIGTSLRSSRSAARTRFSPAPEIGKPAQCSSSSVPSPPSSRSVMWSLARSGATML